MKSKSRHSILLIGIIGVIILAGGATAFSFFIHQGKDDVSKKETAKAAEETILLPLEPFIVNLSSPNGMSFLKTTLSLELAKTPATEKVKEQVPKIRDSIIMLLTNKPAETIASSEGRVQFKEEVIMEINQILGENSVRNVYFTDFVKQ